MYKRNERLNLIRKRVDQYGQVAVKDLAIFLQVTPETVRKDLETLENDKLITRTHGGVIQYNHINKEKSYANKWQKQSQVKERIAKKACFANTVWRNYCHRWWNHNRANSSISQ